MIFCFRGPFGYLLPACTHTSLPSCQASPSTGHSPKDWPTNSSSCRAGRKPVCCSEGGRHHTLQDTREPTSLNQTAAQKNRTVWQYCCAVSSEICVLDSVWIIFDLFKLVSLFCRAVNCLSFVGMVLKLITSTSPSLIFVFKHQCSNWCSNQIVLSLEACCFPVCSRTGPYRNIYMHSF